MSIQVTSVCKTYNTQKALNQVSFSADKGQVIGFLGPNGAGKSTLMKILTGFIIRHVCARVSTIPSFGISDF